jgi:hypothetical protein
MFTTRLIYPSKREHKRKAILGSDAIQILCTYTGQGATYILLAETRRQLETILFCYWVSAPVPQTIIFTL